jgi:hypothetical protein
MDENTGVGRLELVGDGVAAAREHTAGHESSRDTNI